MINSRTTVNCQTDDHAVTPRRRAAVAAPCTNIASLAWPHHVHIADIDPFEYFQRRSLLTEVPRMCVAGSRGAVRQTRAVLMSDPLSCRTSSRLHFQPVARYAHAPQPPPTIALHIHTHHVDCLGLMAVRALRAHARLAAFMSLSTWSPSNIDPKHDNKRRHHHIRAARRSLHRRQHARRRSR